MNKKNFLLSAILIILSGFSTLHAQVLTSKQIDSIAEKTLTTFNVPGIAVAVVKDGKVIHAKGYGVRSLKTKEPVDENTFFGIASNSKAFTAAALGMLVDEGKLNWDDKVVDFIPGFKLYNPYVTQEFTIRDLLTHRSGLGLGAGDLMLWPDSNLISKEGLIHNLRYLKPVSAFRTKYDYDNLLYIVAGEVLAKVSGMSWETFIENRIMRPLGMEHSAAAYTRLQHQENSIDAHAPEDGKLKVITKNFSPIGNAAGGIWSNVNEMSKWVIMQLNGGKYGPDLKQQLFSKEVQGEMWSPQTIIREGNTYSSRFSAYGLGWVLNNINGHLQAFHTGGLGGIVTQVTLIPDLKLGIIVLTNQQSGAAFSAITNSIKDGYLDIKGRDRIKAYKANEDEGFANAKKVTDQVWATVIAEQKKNKIKPDYNVYSGNYRDPWFGEIRIFEQAGKLRFQALQSPKMKGEMSFYRGNTFVVKWDDRSMDADAYAQFTLGIDGKAAGIKMSAISPITDFSYDFQDLDFTRITNTK